MSTKVTKESLQARVGLDDAKYMEMLGFDIFRSASKVTTFNIDAFNNFDSYTQDAYKKNEQEILENIDHGMDCIDRKKELEVQLKELEGGDIYDSDSGVAKKDEEIARQAVSVASSDILGSTTDEERERLNNLKAERTAQDSEITRLKNEIALCDAKMEMYRAEAESLVAKNAYSLQPNDKNLENRYNEAKKAAEDVTKAYEDKSASGSNKRTPPKATSESLVSTAAKNEAKNAAIAAEKRNDEKIAKNATKIAENSTKSSPETAHEVETKVSTVNLTSEQNSSTSERGKLKNEFVEKILSMIETYCPGFKDALKEYIGEDNGFKNESTAKEQENQSGGAGEETSPSENIKDIETWLSAEDTTSVANAPKNVQPVTQPKVDDKTPAGNRYNKGSTLDVLPIGSEDKQASDYGVEV